MEAFKRYIKEFLTFAKWEQRGIVFLSVILVSLMAFTLFYKPSQRKYTTPDISAKIREFECKVLISEERSSIHKEKQWHFLINSPQKKGSYTPFKFDPNTASIRDFQNLGFSLKQSQVIINYRAKGGRFESLHDFKRMYVVSDEHYKALMPYISINLSLGDTVKRNESQSLRFQPVDLNQADTVCLKSLRGIGSAIAQRIVAYREQLGGFVRNEQLLEVYGIDSTKYALLLNQLKQPSKSVKIRINTVDIETLRRHPYISAYEARNIVYYRTKKGNIRDLQQLVSDRIISKSTSNKLSEYIDYSK